MRPYQWRSSEMSVRGGMALPTAVSLHRNDRLLLNEIAFSPQPYRYRCDSESEESERGGFGAVDGSHRSRERRLAKARKILPRVGGDGHAEVAGGTCGKGESLQIDGANSPRRVGIVVTQVGDATGEVRNVRGRKAKREDAERRPFIPQKEAADVPVHSQVEGYSARTNEVGDPDVVSTAAVMGGVVSRLGSDTTSIEGGESTLIDGIVEVPCTGPHVSRDGGGLENDLRLCGPHRVPGGESGQGDCRDSE